MLEQTYSSEFEVEQIIDQKIIDGQTHFLVKWIGYGHEENTWEPLRHMANSKDKIKEWEKYKLKQLRLLENSKLASLDLGTQRKKNFAQDKYDMIETGKNVSNPYQKVLPFLRSETKDNIN